MLRPRPPRGKTRMAPDQGFSLSLSNKDNKDSRARESVSPLSRLVEDFVKIKIFDKTIDP